MDKDNPIAEFARSSGLSLRPGQKFRTVREGDMQKNNNWIPAVAGMTNFFISRRVFRPGAEKKEEDPEHQR